MLDMPEHEAPPVEDALNRAFLLNHPREAARKIETLLPKEAANLLNSQPLYMLLPVWSNLPPSVADNVLLNLSNETVSGLLTALDAGPCAALLSRFSAQKREELFALIEPGIASELKEILTYPPNCAGTLMDTNIIAFNENISVKDAVIQLRNQNVKDLNHLFLLNDEMYLCGEVPVQRLVLAADDEVLATISVPLKAYVSVLDPRSEAMELVEKLKLDVIPVIDGNDHFVGVIRGQNILGALKDTLATEMLTMVGVSKEERALSSSWFTVKKRLPWLQINLLTAFIAAAVVGMFEATIAKYTALAILLPIAAGQSGNTGAQSLAVTMRGLTLREITVRHWPRVLRKEAGAAIVNGIAIAITCGAGVYLWSRSVGLALIIALAMISSMTIAAVAGAMVPIILKKIGQDPALSSSIILTTVTDIAGFMSFLGIATILSGMLDAG